MDAISKIINDIDKFVWDWWMIILLLGTHVFLTIRTGLDRKSVCRERVWLMV